MKKLILLALSVSMLTSCEKIETNNPAFQAEINEVFFKSLGSAAVVNQDNTITIQASTQDQTLTLFLERDRDGLFELGGSNISFASFEDASGVAYITSPEGSGSVEVSSLMPGRSISGSFSFQAFNPGVDTLTVQKGIFFEVPFPSGVSIPVGPDPEISDGSFVATVDGVLFESSDIEAYLSQGGAIIIEATSNGDLIQLIISQTALAGSYSIPGSGFYANFFNDGVAEEGVDGNYRIFEHNTAERKIKGTFSFITEDNTVIQQGQFNISY